MKIAAVRATPVLIPLEAPYVWAYGVLDGFSKTIVEIETADGAVGIGEAPSHGSAAIIDRWAERLRGRDPIDIAGAELACLPFQRGVQSITEFDLLGAWGGVEMALWDLRGRLWGRPVADLLGGAVRREIPFTDYFSYRLAQDGKGGEASVEAVVDYCLMLREAFGTTFFEGKVSDPDVGANIRLVGALRDALGPDAMIRIDSNQAFSVPTAVRLAPAFEEFGVRNWEDPVAGMEEMARLRPRTAIPFSSHNTDLPKALRLGAPDAIVSNVAGFGGFTRMLRFVSACEEMGVDFWCYSGDSGLGTAAYLHACAAHPHIREPNQSLLRMQPFDVIAEGPLAPRNNVLALPEGPGLGVTLDRDRLAFCARLLVERGAPDKHRDPARPGVHRRMPLV
ncbi:MAG: chloromuconate cycloisomerase [Rhodobacteraceae bacterium]|nr:MAG: chloromuconate cycloisomerase [Paracoccaceae bacterium]